MALLCYLTETDDRHGALRVQTGSHADSEQVEEVTLGLRAGDAVVPDYIAGVAGHAVPAQVGRQEGPDNLRTP